MSTTPRRVDGVDISHYQAGTLDMPAAKQAGVRWVFHKATEGTSYKDPGYAWRRQQAKVAGLPFGAYHFARPSGGAADGLAEAKFFLAYAGPVAGDMRPMLDLEVNGGLGQTALTAWVAAWVGEVKRVTGHPPIIYTHFALDSHFDCPLWVARYSNTNGAPSVPKPWTAYTIWQFSDGVYGVPTSVAGFGHIDLNTMNGDPATLTRQLQLPAKVTTPTPAPTPAPTTQTETRNMALLADLIVVARKYKVTPLYAARVLLIEAAKHRTGAALVRVNTARAALKGMI